MKRVFVLLLLTACGSSPPPPKAEVQACAPKTFASDASPIFHTRCTPCHMPGGEAADDHDFARPEKARAQRRLILGKVSTHTMPPPGAGTLTDEETATLLDWASCGD